MCHYIIINRNTSTDESQPSDWSALNLLLLSQRNHDDEVYYVPAGPIRNPLFIHSTTLYFLHTVIQIIHKLIIDTTRV